MTKIAIGCDHAGFDLKNLVKSTLKEIFGYTFNDIKDVGCFNNEPVDYPIIANLVVDSIISNECVNGILICGTGVGMSMVANRPPEIRAVVSDDADTIRLSREHNNANVLCLGSRNMRFNSSGNKLFSILASFIKTDFSQEERHIKRIKLFSYNRNIKIKK